MYTLFTAFFHFTFSFLTNKVNAITHIITEITEPDAVASPIGNNVAGNIFDVKYTPGTRISAIAIILCKNEIPDFPIAQKYPLKQK